MESGKYKYLKKIAGSYPDITAAAAKIIELESILSLPKGTEHFITDIHGEHEAFFHVMKSGSGAVRRKINDALGDSVSEDDKKELATIIYYPKEKMELINEVGGLTDDEYEVLISRMISVCKQSIQKYPRKNVKKALPEEYSYIVEELIYLDPDSADKGTYYQSLIDTTIRLGRADDLIKVMSELIQQMVIARLHIIGDIYDRGPGPHFIMDYLEKHPNFDVQWGNHDVVWMGAALGHAACICNILRSSLRYDGLSIISDGYGINMIPLMQFAAKYYDDDPCECYAIKGREITQDRETQLTLKMHKAISIIQWKIEGQLVIDHPEYHMDDRRVLEMIDYDKGTINIDGREILLKDPYYPTVDPNAPYELNKDEQDLMDKLCRSFKECEKLNRHARLLVNKGGMYLTYNGNLMFHACVLLNEDGSFREVEMDGKSYRGKAWYDALEALVRKGFTSDRFEDKERGANTLWYLWNAPDSPLFGKAKMATFERYITDDKEAQKEKKNPYYSLIKDEDRAEETARNILKEFGLDPDKGIIVNGHVPVKQAKGEDPVKAGGKIYVIDGGFSRSYHKETGIAGYTLVYNSRGKALAAHKPFTSAEDAVKNGDDIISDTVSSAIEEERIYIRDTDDGLEIQQTIDDLYELIDAYKKGEIKESC